MQLNPNSTVHVLLHPSPFTRLPSSQPSDPSMIPSPHTGAVGIQGVPEYPETHAVQFGLPLANELTLLDVLKVHV